MVDRDDIMDVEKHRDDSVEAAKSRRALAG
jgi:hypothetical protein